MFNLDWYKLESSVLLSGSRGRQFARWPPEALAAATSDHIKTTMADTTLWKILQ